MGGFLRPEFIILIVVGLLIFGPKKLPQMGKSIGEGIKEFKKGVNESPADEKSSSSQKSIEAARSELDDIERELAAKKATLSAQETARAEADADPTVRR